MRPSYTFLVVSISMTSDWNVAGLAVPSSQGGPLPSSQGGSLMGTVNGAVKTIPVVGDTLSSTLAGVESSTLDPIFFTLVSPSGSPVGSGSLVRAVGGGGGAAGAGIPLLGRDGGTIATLKGLPVVGSVIGTLTDLLPLEQVAQLAAPVTSKLPIVSTLLSRSVPELPAPLATLSVSVPEPAPLKLILSPIGQHDQTDDASERQEEPADDFERNLVIERRSHTGLAGKSRHLRKMKRFGRLTDQSSSLPSFPVVVKRF